MTSPYDPYHWFWVVGSNATQVYSSEAVQYVSVGNSQYVSWLALGNNPSRIGSEQELWDYLNDKAPGTTPTAGTSTDAGKSSRVRDQMSEVVGQILFEHENRVRALESRPPATRNQFVQHVKDLMK